jgi:hypothetical protein
MPAGFTYPRDSEIWAPLPLQPAGEARDNRYVSVVTRLKPGVSLSQAQAEMDTINQRLAQNYVDTNSGWSVRLTELRESLGRRVQNFTADLVECGRVCTFDCMCERRKSIAGTGGFRQKEIALRTALGASRLRVVRQLLTESVLLSVVSGLGGLALSIWLIKLLIAITPPNTPRIDEIGIDLRVFGFTLGVTVLAGSCLDLFPPYKRRDPISTRH